MIRLVSACVFAAAVLSAAAAHAEKRLALVIGNGAYTEISALENPVNDTRLIGSTLESVGFEVTSVILFEMNFYYFPINNYVHYSGRG